jgi:hypothetical protein
VEEGLFSLTASGTPPAKRGRAPAPLAVRMRPRSLDEVVGQTHLLRVGAPLRRLVEGGTAASVVLYGPPGTGKTTIAGLLASVESRHFVALSALSSGVKDLREVIDGARRRHGAHAERCLVLQERQLGGLLYDYSRLLSQPSVTGEQSEVASREQGTWRADSSSRAVPIPIRQQETPDTGIAAETGRAGRGLAGGCLLTA